MRSSPIRLTLFLFHIGIIVVLTTFKAVANTPSEMAELSLQELFALSTDEPESSKQTPWRLGIVYKQLKQDGYLDGSNDLSNEQVLFEPGEERTDRNFPVLPTVIEQEVFITSLSYALDEISNISINIPIIEQSTDHISIVPGFDAFNISSSGLGDVTFNYSRIFKSWDKQQLSFSIGLSIPTGSIDEQGDTPRAPGNQQLPFTMQLGSGTWDIPAGISYQRDNTSWSWGVNALAKIRVGKNDRDYRLGNRLALTGWTKWHVNQTFQPFVKLIYQNWGTIDGRDVEITVPGPFPFPAGITNPKFFGGEKVNASVGSDISLGDQNLTVELSIPIYQSLNGIQPKEDLNFSISWNTNF